MIMYEMTSKIDDERNEFSSDFKHFQRFFVRVYTPDRPTDGRMDRASYRGAMAHLKTVTDFWYLFLNQAGQREKKSYGY